MKNILLTLLLLSGYSNAWAVTAKEAHNLHPDSIHKQVVNLSNTINKDLPRLVDSETRMDSTAVIEKMFVYKYTLVNFDVGTISGKEIHDYLAPNLINQYCLDPTMSVYRIYGYQMVHTYYDKKGIFLAQIKASIGDCK